MPSIIKILSPKLSSAAFSSLFHHLFNSIKSPSTSSQSQEDSILSTDPPGNSQLVQTVLDVVSAINSELELRRDLQEDAPLVIKERLSGIERQKRVLSHRDEGNVLLEDEMQESGGKQLKLKEARSRLVDIVKQLIISGCIPQQRVNEELEPSLLVSLQILSDESLFNRKEVRLNTQMSYKQSRFNLLREENEGYAALMNALVNEMGPPILPVYSSDAKSKAPSLFWGPDDVHVIEQETPEQRNTRAKQVMENLSALIGYFDLDPTRVLDIILDIFANAVVEHHPFFLALLLASPWGRDRKPAAMESRTKEPSNDNLSAMDLDQPDQSDHIPHFDFSLKEEYGNSTCAQVLGFKFQFYLKEQIKEDVPRELYLATALLIREGFVRMSDLMTHLNPLEEDMPKLHAKYQENLKGELQIARGSNALTMSAPLVDGDNALETSSVAKVQEPTSKELPNHVVGLLQSLLSIGALKQALFILVRHPWLCSAFPSSVADPFIRLLKTSLQPVFSSISLKQTTPGLNVDSATSIRSTFDAKRQQRIIPPLPSLSLTCDAPEPAPMVASRKVFFVEDWRKDIIQCHTEADIFDTFLPLLNILGLQLHRDNALLQSICRLGKYSLEKILVGEHGAVKEGKESQKKAWIDIVRSLILPAFSLCENAAIGEDLWSLLHLLPFSERASLYGEWKYEQYKKLELKAKQVATEHHARRLLKRVSATTVRDSARRIAKASRSNPTIFFNVMLNQIQSYENFIPTLVECAKYLTALEYDILSWNLVVALSNPDRDRTKSDGTNISLWLRCLAAYTASLYKRFAKVDAVPVLQYIVNQLKANNTKDLIVVRELILKHSGIEIVQNLTEAQFAALMGGKLLRRETLMAESAGPSAVVVRRELKESGDRLSKTLRESHLALPLLVFIAQQRQACVHVVQEEQDHLKYLGNLFDSCQETLFQYVEFLYHYVEPAQYSALIPDLKSLCIRFGLEPSIAFHIIRPKLAFEMKTVDNIEAETKLREQVKASKAKAAAAAAAKEAELAEKGKQDPEEAETSVKENGSAEAAVSKAIETTIKSTASQTPALAPTPTPVEPARVKANWHAGLRDAVEAANEFLPDAVKSTIGAHFYVTFWQLTLSDITVPSNRYDQENKLYQQLIKDLDPQKTKPSVKDNFEKSVRALNSELRDQTLAHSVTRRRLAAEKDHWLADTIISIHRQAYVTHILQQCIYPRAFLTPIDAIFSARFIRLMHSQGTRNFSALHMYDKILSGVTLAPTIFSCTENEARNYAIFLHALFSDLTPWVKEEKLYLKEGIGGNLPGFQLRWGTRHGGEDIPADDYMSWPQFVKITFKWQKALAEVFSSCFKSSEYMRIRNAVAIMTKIAPFFPAVDIHGKELLDDLQKMIASEGRGNLKIPAQGLVSTLTVQKKNWVPSHVYQHKEAPADYVPLFPNTVSRTVSTVTTSTASTAPSAPKADRPQVSLASSLPLGPSRPQLTKTDSSGRLAEARESNGIPNKPEAPRISSNSLPARPGQPTSGRSTPTGQHALPERVPPRGPRAESRSISSTTLPPNAQASTFAARQAALDSMNPPRSPATTAGAQTARDRGNSDREVLRNGSTSRMTSSLRLREEADISKSSAQASPRTSRDATPESSRRSRAGSADSAGSRSRTSREKEKDKEQEKEKEKEKEKDRGDKDNGSREHPSSTHRNDREKERKDREAERSERRNRTDEKEFAIFPPTPTGPRGSRSEDKDRSRSSSSGVRRNRSDRQEEIRSEKEKEKEKAKELLTTGPSSTSNGRDRGHDDRNTADATSSIPQKRGLGLVDRLGGIDSPSSPSETGNTSIESSSKRSKVDRSRSNAKYGTFFSNQASTLHSTDSSNEADKDKEKDRSSSRSRHRSGDERSSSKRDRSERDKDEKSSHSKDRSSRDKDKESSSSSRDRDRDSSSTAAGGPSGEAASTKSRHASSSSRYSSSKGDRSGEGSSRDRGDDKDRKKRRSGNAE